MTVCLHPSSIAGCGFLSSFICILELKQICFSEFYMGLGLWSLSVTSIFMTDISIKMIKAAATAVIKA